MLSAETAAGNFPVFSVEIMDRIIRNVENDISYRQLLNSKPVKLEETTSDAISAAASQVVNIVAAKAIFTYTRSGKTAIRAARERAICANHWSFARRLTSRQLALVWGVHTIHALEPKSFSGMIENACELSKKKKLLKKEIMLSLLLVHQLELQGQLIT